jgi:hypothetical protein
MLQISVKHEDSEGAKPLNLCASVPLTLCASKPLCL